MNKNIEINDQIIFTFEHNDLKEGLKDKMIESGNYDLNDLLNDIIFNYLYGDCRDYRFEEKEDLLDELVDDVELIKRKIDFLADNQD